MVRLPIGLVVCPPPKNPGDAPSNLGPNFGGTGGDLSLTESLPRPMTLRSTISPTARGVGPFSQLGVGNAEPTFMGDYGHMYGTGGAGTLATKYNIGGQGI